MIKKENASKCGKFTTTTTENLAYPGKQGEINP